MTSGFVVRILRRHRHDSTLDFVSWLGFLDHDIAQVERLAGLDGEVLADLDALLVVVDGREVGDPVQRAGDQAGQGDAALGVGAGPSQ